MRLTRWEGDWILLVSLSVSCVGSRSREGVTAQDVCPPCRVGGGPCGPPLIPPLLVGRLSAPSLVERLYAGL